MNFTNPHSQANTTLRGVTSFWSSHIIETGFKSWICIANGVTLSHKQDYPLVFDFVDLSALVTENVGLIIVLDYKFVENV